MPTRSLPEDPSLENLKKQSKRLHKSVRAGDAEGLEAVHEFHPRADEALADFALSDAQLVVARSYRFDSWPKLKQHLEVVAQYRWDPTENDGPPPPTGSMADRMVQLACMNYGDWHPSRAATARRLVQEHPELAHANIYAAATIGDVAAARSMLAATPALANRKGGPNEWEPLLYACYSRFDSPEVAHSTLEVARLLLAHGADPNSGFLWRGYVPPFTALTGAFGEGEDGNNQPRHQHCEALARLLLDAGADPNDGQTLYNRHFRPNDDHLKLLFSYGLGQDRGGPWFKRLGDRLDSPRQMLVEELWAAASMNMPERVKLLVEQGTDVNTPGHRDGRTPYQAAMRAGNRDIAEYLLRHGAQKTHFDLKEIFAAACVAGAGQEARALLAEDATLMEKLGETGRTELVHTAVAVNRAEAIRLMAELGFNLSGMTRNTPMHNAAWTGNLSMVKLLIELGADPHVREPSFNATPLGWAAHNQQRAVVEYLVSFAAIGEAVECGAVARVAALLQADPSLAQTTDGDGAPLWFHLHPGLERLDEMIALLRRYGADLNLQSRDGKTVVDEMLARGCHDFAAVLRSYGAKTAQELV
jgi:ankyrin repeat protein